MRQSVEYTGAVPVHNRQVGQATGTGGRVVPGQTVDVPAALAERLVASGGWKMKGRGRSVRGMSARGIVAAASESATPPADVPESVDGGDNVSGGSDGTK